METISEDVVWSRNDGLKAILFGGLAAGILDITAASVNIWLNSGRGPVRTFQSVAGSVLIHIFFVGLPISLIVRRFSK